MISAPTQALIDQAEADIPVTHDALTKVTGDQSALAADNATLTTDQAALLAAENKQASDALAALNALAVELGVPPGTVLGSPPAGSPTGALAHSSTNEVSVAKARITRALRANSVVGTALNLGIDWGTIISTLIQAGIPALQLLIQNILDGLKKPTAAA